MTSARRLHIARLGQAGLGISMLGVATSLEVALIIAGCLLVLDSIFLWRPQ